jgi:hypothetical protein
MAQFCGVKHYVSTYWKYKIYIETKRLFSCSRKISYILTKFRQKSSKPWHFCENSKKNWKTANVFKLHRAFAPVLHIYLKKLSRKKCWVFAKRNLPQSHVMKTFSQKLSHCFIICGQISPFCDRLKDTQDWEFFDSDFGICVISLLVMSKY